MTTVPSSVGCTPTSSTGGGSSCPDTNWTIRTRQSSVIAVDRLVPLYIICRHWAIIFVSFETLILALRHFTALSPDHEYYWLDPRRRRGGCGGRTSPWRFCSAPPRPGRRGIPSCDPVYIIVHYLTSQPIPVLTFIIQFIIYYQQFFSTLQLKTSEN